MTETPLGERGLFAGQYNDIAAIVDPDWLAAYLPPMQNLASERPSGATACEQFAGLHYARASGADEASEEAADRLPDGEDGKT